MTTPKVYMLIGVPGSGKSTWVANQEWAKDIPVVSSDKFIDEHAAKEGKTYNDVFADYVKIATRLMDNQVLICKANNTDIIWDQTNTSAKSRKAKLDKLDGYEKIAVYFPTPEKEELDNRLAQRVGKHIPSSVMSSMIANLEVPTEEEGFNEIWFT